LVARAVLRVGGAQIEPGGCPPMGIHMAQQLLN